ncbi:twin-arginine translocation signal domain-containing protein [Streptomyces sp. NPDC060366]|uniref:twin-arginine translocation signal domain-containing protein n=1 Tax=Streptomyces sp. NPDC060366 TaxID=3347105 RepID=UPI003649583C
MGDDAEHRDHREHGEPPEHGEHPGRLDRRRFLGAAAAGAAGIAVGAVAGCDSPADGGPEVAPSRTGADATADGAAERARSGSPDWRIRPVGPPEAVEGYTAR